MRLINTTKSIGKKFTQAIRDFFTLSIPRIRRDIKDQISPKVKNWIYSSPEAVSMLDNNIFSLKGHLGITEQESRIVLDKIIDIISESISVNISKRTTKNIFDISLGILPSRAYRAILNMPEGRYISKGEHSDEVAWLFWLLEEGTRVLVDFDIVWGAFPSSYSKTGLAVMVNPGNGVWRVPPEYAGTKDNNFITRALIENRDEISDIIKNNISKVLKNA